MLFNSLQYFVFFLVLLPIFFNLSAKNQRYLLFFFSLYFYSCLKLVFVPLLFFSFLITHLTSLAIFHEESIIKKKLYLTTNLFTNLGLLGLFKYADFIRYIEYDVYTLLNISSLPPEPWGFILPLGISFYTFQAIAYTMDVYRNKLIPEKSFFNFSLFLLFFPQLVAGPIMRASELMHQFQSKKNWNKDKAMEGLGILCMGFFKKTIIADPITNIIQPIYSNPSEHNAISNLVGLFLFTIQIYCDFSGYSDIAIGSGKILGFEIPKNFERPFLSSSVTITWRRWHISLSTWLRDYVYISLGGNRVSTFRNFFNLFMTTLVGGFWHGANWTFIIWGTINGIFTIIEKIFTDKGWDSFFIRIPHPLRVLYSFLIFMIGANFFRSESVSHCFQSFKQIFTLSRGLQAEGFELRIFLPIFFLFLIEVLEEINYLNKIISTDFYKAVRTPIFIGILTICIMIYTVVSSPQFYYFQF